jgi:hypothetical protein
MTNSIALALGLVVVALLAIDLAWFGGEGSLFLAREGLGLIEWLAIWR